MQKKANGYNTTFFIRFNKVFFHLGAVATAFWERLEQTLQNANRLPGCILKEKEQHILIDHLMQCLLAG
jgi:hypothetical protein